MEAALKMARRYQHEHGDGRSAILGLERGFHGRSMGALSCTWQQSYREPFER